MGRRKGQIYSLFLQINSYEEYSELQLPSIPTQTVQLISAVQLKHILWSETNA